MTDLVPEGVPEVAVQDGFQRVGQDPKVLCIKLGSGIRSSVWPREARARLRARRNQPLPPPNLALQSPGHERAHLGKLRRRKTNEEYCLHTEHVFGRALSPWHSFVPQIAVLAKPSL